MKAGMLRHCAGVVLLGLGALCCAQTSSPGPVVPDALAQRSVNDWLLRMHQASQQPGYVGTFVVSTGRSMASARIWHACDGAQQIERIESLTGSPRSTFRYNQQVTTFLPERRLVVTEKREALGLFPHLLTADGAAIGRLYRLQAAGRERVAGYPADVMQLRPADHWRFGYRVWSEQQTGLVVKLQTLDADGQVLEQSAFSDLELGAPVNLARLRQMMDATQGYQIETPGLEATSARAQGWVVKTVVPGFELMGCQRRAAGPVPAGGPLNALQWIFSDGLASVSLFVEPFDAQRHAEPGSLALGATHVLTQRRGNWWLAAVGEVPPQTLVAFVKGLERRQ